MAEAYGSREERSEQVLPSKVFFTHFSPTTETKQVYPA